MTRYLRHIGIIGFALLLGSAATLLGEGQQKVEAFVVFAIVGVVLGIGLLGDYTTRNETQRVIGGWFIAFAAMAAFALVLIHGLIWLRVLG